MSIARAPRKDAARNRLRVLDSARRVFAARGLDASVEDIADDAGVGVATIYRAFGSRDGLIQTLFATVVDEAAAVLQECALAPTGWEALCTALRRMTAMNLNDRGAYQALFDPTERTAQHLRERIAPLLTSIVQRAKSEGTLRSDFAATDMAVFAHIASATASRMEHHGVETASRTLELLIKGVAASPDPVPIPDPLPDEEFDVWLRATHPL